MSEYYHIVPWIDTDEWNKACDGIYSSDQTKVKAALNLLQIWKARCPSLPSGIESTLTLLQVKVDDEWTDVQVANDQLLRLAYSSAIMRFVNHILDSEAAKGASLYQAAKNLGIPDWIIDLRHDAAHSHNLPGIPLLREASFICTNWLKTNYWFKHRQCISNYKSGQKEYNNLEEHKIATLMDLYLSLGICVHPKCNFNKLSDIPDPVMQESIVNDARDLLGNYIDLSNLKTVSVMSLINLMNVHSKNFLKLKHTISLINTTLLGDDSLFLSIEILNNLSVKKRKQKLDNSYMQCFELLLTFLHSNDLLLEFLFALMKITENQDCDENKALLAALWIAEIFNAIKRSQKFIHQMNRVNPEDLSSRTRNELKTLYHHWFPNEQQVLLLDLNKSVPDQLKNLNYIQPIISSYNPYLNYFVKELLQFLEPKLPDPVLNEIYQLSQLLTTKNVPANFNSKIYTVDDLKDLEMDISSECPEGNFDEEMLNEDIIYKDTINSGIWKLASIEHSWSTCPIGQVPWQSKEGVISK